MQTKTKLVFEVLEELVGVRKKLGGEKQHFVCTFMLA